MAAAAYLDALAHRLGRVRASRRGTGPAPGLATLAGTARLLARRGAGGGRTALRRSTAGGRGPAASGGYRRGRRGDGTPRFAHDVRERFKVVSALLGGIPRQADHVPAARDDETCGVLLAQVIAVRFLICRQRPENGRGVAVHVRERVDGRLLARST
jgi:hypothetical protein